jgi:hypothetical protein
MLSECYRCGAKKTFADLVVTGRDFKISPGFFKEIKMSSKRIFIAAVLSLIALFTACKDSGVITELEGINKNLVNSPSVANTVNSFSIAVTADTFNSALEYPVTFEKAEFDIALAIANMTAGSVSIQIFNNTKQMLYNGEFTEKISLAQHITLEEKPTKVKFVFNSLKASFSCALTVK